MKKMLKSTLIILLLICFTLICFACNPTDNNPNTPDTGGGDTPITPVDPVTPVDPSGDELLRGSVKLVSAPDGVALYDGAKVYVEQEELDLFNVKVNNSHTWVANPQNRDDSGVGYFSLKGKTTVKVESAGMTSCVVRPLSAGVEVACKDEVATFVIKSAGTYVVEPNGDAKKAFCLFVSDIQAEVAYFGNIIRFEKGLHTSENSRYIANNTVNLSSNTIVVIEDGAVVRARFVAHNASNISIVGGGIIDGSQFDRNATTGTVTVPLDFNFCSNIRFEDFSVLDPAGWCVNWYFCKNSKIDGIKIISSRSNGDGISLQSCSDIEVKNCFLRTWDDSLVVKNYALYSDKSVEGETKNITFSNCVIWTDLAQSMEIGYETIGKVMQDIRFENITVLHNFHKPVMSIHNANNADIKNVVFDTITVEDASMGRGDAGSNSQLCEFAVEFSSTWSTNHKTTALGSIVGVSVKNVSVLSGNMYLPIRVAGSRDMRSGYAGTEHRVKNVTFENVWINGRGITNDYAYLSVNKYAEAEVLSATEEKRATFEFSQSQTELAKYADHADIVK